MPRKRPLKLFRATEGSTESPFLQFGVKTVLWPRAAKNGGQWYQRGGLRLGGLLYGEVVQGRGTDCSWLRHAA